MIGGLIVLGLVAKDIAVLERRRLRLASGFFCCRLGSLVELRSGFLLGYDFGIGRSGDFGFGFCRYLNSDFDLGLGLGFWHGFNHGFRLGTLNVLGAHGLEVLLAAFFLFVGLLGSLGSLGLVLALGKGGIPGLVGDDRGIQATALKDGQLNAVVELLEQLARGLEAQVISGHVTSGECLLDLRHKRLLAASNRIAQQAIQIDVVAQRKRGRNYCLAHGKSPLYTPKHLTIARGLLPRRPRQTGATVAGSRPLYRSIIYEGQTCLVARCRALARAVRCRAGRGSTRAVRVAGVAAVC